MFYQWAQCKRTYRRKANASVKGTLSVRKLQGSLKGAAHLMCTLLGPEGLVQAHILWNGETSVPLTADSPHSQLSAASRIQKRTGAWNFPDADAASNTFPLEGVCGLSLQQASISAFSSLSLRNSDGRHLGSPQSSSLRGGPHCICRSPRVLKGSLALVLPQAGWATLGILLFIS